jgi:pyridoxal phosphate enzyme (YggS family)
MSIADRIARLRDEIAAAARRAGRDPQAVSLMAVSKSFSPESIEEAYDAGIRRFGENRVQEFSTKKPELVRLRGASWHLVGHLQSNKAARAVELFDAIDSLDSLRLARKLDHAAREFSKRLPVLIEINIGGEEAKSGVLPDSQELQELLSTAPQLTGLEFRGLMTIPPYHDDPNHSRPYFRKMRRLFDRLAQLKLEGLAMETLSMGMSHDFQIAIEEGATCVRVGTAIFGKRKSAGSDE